MMIPIAKVQIHKINLPDNSTEAVRNGRLMLEKNTLTISVWEDSRTFIIKGVAFDALKRKGSIVVPGVDCIYLLVLKLDPCQMGSDPEE